MRLDGLATQLEPSIVPVIIGSSASAIHGSSRSLISSRTQGRDANSVESIPSHLETRACERPSLPSSLPAAFPSRSLEPTFYARRHLHQLLPLPSSSSLPPFATALALFIRSRHPDHAHAPPVTQAITGLQPRLVSAPAQAD